MKIEINQIPFEGLTLTEEFIPRELDLETDAIKFRGNVLARAVVSKISSAVTVNLNISTLIYANCSRCLDEFEFNLKKEIILNYPAGRQKDALAGLSINLDPDIREEIILDYPIKPLCRADCKGLCPKCGKNLNEGRCGCFS